MHVVDAEGDRQRSSFPESESFKGTAIPLVNVGWTQRSQARILHRVIIPLSHPELLLKIIIKCYVIARIDQSTIAFATCVDPEHFSEANVPIFISCETMCKGGVSWTIGPCASMSWAAEPHSMLVTVVQSHVVHNSYRSRTISSVDLEDFSVTVIPVGTRYVH